MNTSAGTMNPPHGNGITSFNLDSAQHLCYFSGNSEGLRIQMYKLPQQSGNWHHVLIY